MVTEARLCKLWVIHLGRAINRHRRLIKWAKKEERVQFKAGWICLVFQIKNRML